MPPLTRSMCYHLLTCHFLPIALLVVVWLLDMLQLLLSATLPPILNRCLQAVLSPATACPLLLLLLAGCCVVVRRRHPLLSLHTVMRPSMLSYPQVVSSPATAHLCCSCCWLVVALLSATCFCHHLVVVHCPHLEWHCPLQPCKEPAAIVTSI
jgi:hypothetical protein